MYVLLKDGAVKLLLRDSFDMSQYLQRRDEIAAFNTAMLDFYRNAMHATTEDVAHVKRMKQQLADFAVASGVIGSPFDTHDAELYALDRKLQYDVLELRND